MQIHCKYDELLPIPTIERRLNPKNRNKHPEPQIEAIVQQFEYQGIRHPIIISKRSGLVVAGEGRFLAAKKLALENFPISNQEFESEEQEYAFGVADNAIANWSDLDLKEIKVDVKGLPSDFNLTLLGIEGFELEKKPEEKDNETPATPKEPKSRGGDLFVLGSHRLVCGDCSDPSVIEKLMCGATAQLIFTDPPYNLASDAKLLAARGLRDSYDRLAESEWDKNFQIEKVFPSFEKILGKDSSIYVCTSHFLFGSIQNWLKSFCDITNYCVWSKPNPMPSLAKRHWTWCSELICYGTRGSHTFNFPLEGHALNVWEIQKNQKNDLHPTQKPVEVPEHAILASSKAGDLVVDLFLGSGSTLIACEKNGRICSGTEVNPAFCDVILDRWAEFSGKDPVRHDGKKWSEVKNGSKA